MKALLYTMAIGDVAEVLGVCTQRVRQLDGELEPVRGRQGYRRYDPRVVERVAKRREANR